MKLTIPMRNAYVRDVISKLPHTDYRELIRQVAYKEAFNQAPLAIQNMLVSDSTKDWVAHQYWHFHNAGISLPSAGNFRPREAALKTLKELEELDIAQKKRDRALELKLQGVARGCNTTAQLREALPEFAKYVPEDPVAAVRTLPTLTGVVEEFKREGWKP